MNRPIYTLTGNLLWERTLQYTYWQPGRTQRAVSETFQVGGKGINVSKMLSRLGEPSTALCFVGAEVGGECRTWLARQPFAHHAFSTSSPTRVGFVVRGEGQTETTFLGPDRPADAAALAACADFLTALPDGSTLALCGSFPGWDTAEAATLRTALGRLAQRGTLVVDSYGPPLRWALDHPVALVKINHDEFDLLFGEDGKGAPLDLRLAEARKRWPVRGWVVTDGAREVWFCDADHPPTQVTPPPVHEVSATGSGDVFLAALLHATLSAHLTLAKAVSFAIPYAAANAAHPGIAEFDLNNLPT